MVSMSTRVLGAFLCVMAAVVVIVGSGRRAVSSVAAQSDVPESAASNSGDVVASPSPDVSPSSDPAILQKTPLSDKRQKLRDQYRGEIEAYRLAEQEYLVAKGQWESVKTLVALETVVQKTKAVQLARCRALEVYLELVQTTLLDTEGVNLAQRSPVSDELTARINDLKAHETKLLATDDRDGVNARSDEFELLTPQLVSSAHKGMALIAVGKLQNVSDLARLLHGDIVEMQKTATVSALRQAERDRANHEIERSQDEITTQMQEINTTLQDAQPKVVTDVIYTRTQQELGPVYANLSQILSFLQESLKY